MNTERAEKLFLAIGGVTEELVSEAEQPGEPWEKRPLRWLAMAAVFALVAGAVYLLPVIGIGGNAGGAGISGDSAAPGATVFMSYAGPVLPLTVVDGPDGLSADREVSWDFAAAGETGSRDFYQVTVTDSTTIRNDGAEDLTITVGYPVTADLRTEGESLPSLTADGKALKASLLWGDAKEGKEEEPMWSAPRLESWEDVRILLEDGSCLENAQKEAPALEQTVTVWELKESVAPETDRGAPTLAIRFRLDEEKTQVFTYGFNGGEFGEDGTRRYSYFVPRQQDRDSRRLLIFLGEVPEGYTMEGYEDGGCEKVLEGVSAQMSAFTTTLGELLDQLVEEGREEFRRLEEMKTAVRRQMDRFLSKGRRQYDYFLLEDHLSLALVSTRVVWTTAEVTIPAGERVTITARYQKEPSFDYTCAKTENQGLYGFDLGTRLGSNLAFGRITARLENTQGVEIVREDFGFRQTAGGWEAEIASGQEHCAIEVRRRPSPALRA